MKPSRTGPGTLVTLRSAAAILCAPDRRYVLQHRENIRGIDYPDAWCLFGGSIDPGEMPFDAIKRELNEEIGFIPASLEYFSILTWDMSFYDDGINERWIYRAHLDEPPESIIRLAEGQGWRAFTIDELEDGVAIIPHDLFALHMFERRFEHRAVRSASAASRISV